MVARRPDIVTRLPDNFAQLADMIARLPDRAMPVKNIPSQLPDFTAPPHGGVRQLLSEATRLCE